MTLIHHSNGLDNGGSGVDVSQATFTDDAATAFHDATSQHYQITFMGVPVNRTADQYGEIHLTLDTNGAAISNDVITLSGGTPPVGAKAVLKVTF